MSAKPPDVRPVVGVIGAGEMGSMLIASSDRFGPDCFRLCVSSRSAATLERLRAQVPSLMIGELADVARRADLLLLCVPPCVMLDIAAEAVVVMREGAVLVSISNGVAIEALDSLTGRPVVRAIPSIAHAIGRGNVLLTAGSRADRSHLYRVAEFFGCFSKPVIVHADDSRFATNVTGCGPALLASFCKALVQANARHCQHLDESALSELMMETLAATAKLAMRENSFDRLMARSSTKGGMTEAAVDRLNQSLPVLMDNVVAATVTRQKSQNAARSFRQATAGERQLERAQMNKSPGPAS